MLVLKDVASNFYILEIGIVLLLLLLCLLETFLFLFYQLFVVCIGADESHEALIEGV